MPVPEPQALLDDLAFPEGPRWHNGRLWFSDMHAHEVVAVDVQGRRETVVNVPNKPSGLGWLPDGRLLVVSMLDRRLMRLERGGLVVHADLSPYATSHCNDMVVDRQGRAYVGNFGADIWKQEPPKPAHVVLVTPDGKARIAARDLLFPNGTVITPDGRTLIVGESRGQRLTAFDVQPDGSLTNQRVWADIGMPPDGICLDAEGCVWVAAPRRPGGFVRVAEGGAIKERIELTDRGGFACMLGGPDRRTLFMLEALGSGADSKPGNGRIRAVEVEVAGAGWP